MDCFLYVYVESKNIFPKKRQVYISHIVPHCTEMHFGQYQASSASCFTPMYSQISQKKAGLIVMQNVRHLK